jgi:hypothetical protein
VPQRFSPAANKNKMNEQFLTATRAYLKDFAGDGHSIIQIQTLINYGFSGVWVRDLAERHESKGDHKWSKWSITVNGQPVDHFVGVWSLDLLRAFADELRLSGAELDFKAAARVAGCSPSPMGRGTTARLYTAAIRAALDQPAAMP